MHQRGGVIGPVRLCAVAVYRRMISAWVAILAVPTLVAAIYGMNFDYIPELNWDYGYPAVLALIALLCVLLYRRFKRAVWL